MSYRIGIFISHVPWLGAMFLSHPEWIPLGELKKFRIDAQTRALRRIKEGSPYKDLFHYLVRYIFNLLPETGDKYSIRSMRIVLVPTSHLFLRL